MKDFSKVKDILSTMISKVEVKSDLTPQEVENVKCAAEALYKLQIVEAMENADKDGSMHYAGDYMNPDMYGRGRSRDSMGRYTGNMNNDLSRMYGHSIKDRMIDNLERMMDSASSEYERQQISEEIERLRSSSH